MAARLVLDTEEVTDFVLPRKTAQQPSLVGPKASDYQSLDQRTHVYLRPEMYIDSIARQLREEWVFDFVSKQMSRIPLDTPLALERLYLEILSNASDNVGRSRRAGVSVGEIVVKMTNDYISVTNGGLPIPVALAVSTLEDGTTVQRDYYVAQLIFGTMLAGSNFSGDRHDAGVNGIGAKATNIFSRKFIVHIHDAVRHLSYYQEWTDNMKVCNPPTIVPYSGDSSMTQVTYYADFERFGYSIPVNETTGGYGLEIFQLFARHAADTSLNAKVPVSFNDYSFNLQEIKEYSRLYFGNRVDKAVIHIQHPDGEEVKKKRKGNLGNEKSLLPMIELIAVDTPNEGQHVSFVNCIMTKHGGPHVNEAIRAVGEGVAEVVTNTLIKRLTKGGKKEIDAKTKRIATVTVADLKSHISVLLVYRCTDPKFREQSKHTLVEPKPIIKIDENVLFTVKQWALMEYLSDAMGNKLLGSLPKVGTQGKAHLNSRAGEDANEAGRASGRGRCTLYITEGKSGNGYAEKLLKHIPGGRNYTGTLPMRGKGLNTATHTALETQKNTELATLVAFLGLEYSTDYSDERKRSKLRYAHLRILADSDDDGKHIIALILNFFFCYFPSLLAAGFVSYYRTPIVRVKKGKGATNYQKFYFEHDYRRWKEATPDQAKWSHHYYKGLATSKDEEIAEDYADAKIVLCRYDENAPAALRLAFAPKMTNERKDWILDWKDLPPQHSLIQDISYFVHHELVLYSRANLIRSIPKLMDGFKEALRKVIHGAHLKWNISTKARYEKFKVAQFASFIAYECKYHHGEGILHGVITKMGQRYIGSNNVPLLVDDGQFGTRFNAGKDAGAGRYTHTHPEPILAYIFRKEDQPILKYIFDEGQQVEPETYYPIVPMVLVNGVDGIGTGYSTFVPCHNIVDIIHWLLNRLQGKTKAENIEVKPWYNGFTGKIEVYDRSKKGVTPLVTPENPPEDAEIFEGEFHHDPRERPLLSMITTGKYNLEVTSGTVTITELPIGRSPTSYLEWLKSLLEAKKITDYRNYSIDDVVHIEIMHFSEMVNERSLKLVKSFGISNMVLLDEYDRPRRYDTVYHILEEFYGKRLQIYEERRAYQVKALEAEILEDSERLRFYEAIRDEKLIIKGVTEEEVLAQLDALKLSRDFYEKAMVRGLNATKIAGLQASIQKSIQELNRLRIIDVKEIWTSELQELLEFHLKHNKRKAPVKKRATLTVE